MSEHLGPYLLGPNDTPENGIYTGDARELAMAIPDESVDLIFTDPVYQNIDDYCWLAETAARVLKQNKPCLVFCGNQYKAAVLAAMSVLKYRWDFANIMVGFGGFRYVGKIAVKVLPLFWFDKGHVIPAKTIFGSQLISTAHREPKGHSRWNKRTITFTRYVETFCEPGAIVLDPFTGGGTVPAVCKMFGRKCLAFEIDPGVAQTARERVRMTQMPLFVVEPEQKEFLLSCP